MSATRFFDEVARTLAEPMPRRRAVRIVGASLAAIAMPGVAPRIARAATATSHAASSTCPPRSGRRQCYTAPDWKPGRPDAEPYCCKFPWQQHECGDEDNGYQCKDQCPSWNRVLKKNQKPCWSTERDPDGKPKRYNCCLVPDQICDPSDIDLCLTNCRLAYAGQGYEQCGQQCCPPGSQCRLVDGRKTCVQCRNTCKPPRGRAQCCKRGEKCCFNAATAACCGPEQTCKATGKRATCKCPSGTKCGSNCCERNQTCCRGEECCDKGATCTPQGCCPKGRAICRDSEGKAPVCCDDGESCLWKAELVPGSDPLIPLRGVCNKGCAPGNRAGTQCCGTGFKPNRGKTGCVQA